MNHETIAILLSWAARLSGYEIPDGELSVDYVPHSWFVETMCGGSRNCRVIGGFLDDDGPYTLYVDDRLENVHNMYAASFVVHEQVHFLQYHSGQFDPYDCADSLKREREAYFLQNEFLVANGNPPIMRMVHGVCAK